MQAVGDPQEPLSQTLEGTYMHVHAIYSYKLSAAQPDALLDAGL